MRKRVALAIVAGAERENTHRRAPGGIATRPAAGGRGRIKVGRRGACAGRFDVRAVSPGWPRRRFSRPVIRVDKRDFENVNAKIACRKNQSCALLGRQPHFGRARRAVAVVVAVAVLNGDKTGRGKKNKNNNYKNSTDKYNNRVLYKITVTAG